MPDATEAAADVVTGAIIATAVEPQAGSTPPPDAAETRVACLNCGAVLTGAYCAACGQPAHIHRTFVSLGHDVLHSVFHFDGKFWRTLPELAFHPGRLTRRYIDGERAKFISPMALYLFSVFLMYAVFGFTGGAAPSFDPTQIPIGGFQRGSSAAIENTRQSIRDVETQLGAPGLSAERRAELEQQKAGLEASVNVLEALARGDWASANRIQDQIEEEVERERKAAPARATTPESAGASAATIRNALEEVNDNPSLMAYKLKTNGYKYSWALVPLSIPFMWLLFFWRRDIRGYDHAIFVTYSISFMMLLLIFVSLLGLAGVGSGYLTLIVLLVPPLHMYKQLRGAYALSRFGAFVRLAFLVVTAFVVLSIFTSLLFVIGVLH